ncbi:hypothetical protein CAL7102_06403 [Dulcicalothrix desertica PCC 7102]|nr:hypothetical protein CAL7102_06403 [Dulcicalothrix desertica PCC 7102]
MLPFYSTYKESLICDMVTEQLLKINLQVVLIQLKSILLPQSHTFLQVLQLR